MRKLTQTLLTLGLVLTLITGSAFGAIQKAKPLPDPDVVQSNLNSLDDAITGIYVSTDYKTDNPKVKTNQDLDKVEQEMWSDFVHGRGAYEKYKGIPTQRKSLRVTRYEQGDPRTTDVLLDAQKQNMGEVILMTDPNTFMEGDFSTIKSKEGFDKALRTGKIKLKTVPGSEDLLPGAKEFKRLYDAGFEVLGAHNPYSEATKIVGPHNFIVFQPLYPKDANTMIPIMHQKESVMGIIAEKRTDEGDLTLETAVDSTSSTHNHSLPPNYKIDKDGNVGPKTRYNRLLKITEENIIKYSFDHATRMMKSLGNGEGIDKTEPMNPLKVVFKDKSYSSRAYTDGRFNPNERGAHVMQTAIDHPEDVILRHTIKSHFVYDYKDDLQAWRDLIKFQRANPKLRKTKLIGVYNGVKFNQIHDWGFAPALSGYRVTRQMGPPIYPFDAESQKQMNNFGWQQPVEGVDPEDLPIDGPPLGEFLWHDKTTIYKGSFYKLDGTLVYTGSLNDSGHFANAELQDEMFFVGKSQAADGIVESVVKVIRIGSTAKIAVRERRAVLRIEISKIIGRAVLRLSLKDIKAIEVLLVQSQKDPKAIEALSTKLTDLYNALPAMKNSPTKKDQFDERLSTLTEFLTWAAKDSNDNGTYWSIPRLISTVSVLIFDGERPARMKGALDFYTWKPDQDPARKEAMLKKIWKELFPKVAYPSKEDGGPSESVGSNDKKDSKTDKDDKAEKPKKTAKVDTTKDAKDDDGKSDYQKLQEERHKAFVERAQVWCDNALGHIAKTSPGRNASGF